MTTKKSQKKGAKKAAVVISANPQNQVNTGVITSDNDPTDSLTSDVATLSLGQNTASEDNNYAPVPEILSIREQQKLNRKRDIVGEFSRYFGEKTKLANWQRLCRDVGIEDGLQSVTKCREVGINFPFPSTLSSQFSTVLSGELDFIRSVEYC